MSCTTEDNKGEGDQTEATRVKKNLMINPDYHESIFGNMNLFVNYLSYTVYAIATADMAMLTVRSSIVMTLTYM